MADPRFKYQITLANVDKYCLARKYSATIPDPAIPGGTLPNPETKAQFMGRDIADYINGIIGLTVVSASINTRKNEDIAAMAAVAILPVEIT